MNFFVVLCVAAASLQTQEEWRRYSPETCASNDEEVAKTCPWVPILSREAFTVQQERVTRLLANVPSVKLMFLNDLQCGPSACGRGKPLCRWTSDYGNRRTTIPPGDDAATLFISAIRRTSPAAEIIPVWTTATSWPSIVSTKAGRQTMSPGSESRGAGI